MREEQEGGAGKGRKKVGACTEPLLKIDKGKVVHLAKKHAFVAKNDSLWVSKKLRETAQQAVAASLKRATLQVQSAPKSGGEAGIVAAKQAGKATKKDSAAQAAPHPRQRVVGRVAGNVTGTAGGLARQLAGQAISIRQAGRHRVWAEIREECGTMERLLDRFEEMRLARKWKFSTARTALGALLGAQKRFGLPLTREEQTLVNDFSRALDLKVIAEKVDYPEPLSATDAKATISGLYEANHKQAALWMLIQWATSCRPHCAALLEKSNFHFTKTGISLTFTRGKGAISRRQPYTVHTKVPDNWNNRLRRFVKLSRDPLFPSSGREYEALKKLGRCELKKSNKLYKLGSVRRGALEAIAAAGAPLETLMSFSGHKNAATLKRYLRWGREFAKEAASMKRFTTKLWGRSRK